MQLSLAIFRPTLIPGISSRRVFAFAVTSTVLEALMSKGMLLLLTTAPSVLMRTVLPSTCKFVSSYCYVCDAKTCVANDLASNPSLNRSRTSTRARRLSLVAINSTSSRVCCKRCVIFSTKLILTHICQAPCFRKTFARPPSMDRKRCFDPGDKPRPYRFSQVGASSERACCPH